MVVFLHYNMANMLCHTASVTPYLVVFQTMLFYYNNY